MLRRVSEYFSSDRLYSLYRVGGMSYVNAKYF